MTVALMTVDQMIVYLKIDITSFDHSLEGRLIELQLEDSGI